MKLYIQVGRSTKVLGNVKVPPPLNFTFNRLGQQRYLGNIKIDIQLLMMMMVMMMMMRCPSSLQFGSKPRHLPHIYIYIYLSIVRFNSCYMPMPVGSVSVAQVGCIYHAQVTKKGCCKEAMLSVAAVPSLLNCAYPGQKL